jgi:hypothetical protein
MLTEKNQTRDYPLTTRLLITGGAIGPLLFTMVYLIEGATRPGYDAWRQAASALSLSEQGWMQIVNFIVCGLLILGFAVGLWQTLRGGRGATWGPILLAAVGAGLMIAGIFVTDPAQGYPPGTLAGPALHVAFAIASAQDGPAGLFERISLSIGMAWMAFFAARLLLRMRSPVSTPRSAVGTDVKARRQTAE